jgi:hypothetical protein
MMNEGDHASSASTSYARPRNGLRGPSGFVSKILGAAEKYGIAPRLSTASLASGAYVASHRPSAISVE